MNGKKSEKNEVSYQDTLQKKKKGLFPASDQPYSEAPILFFFLFGKKKVNNLQFAVYKRKRRADEEN